MRLRHSASGRSAPRKTSRALQTDDGAGWVALVGMVVVAAVLAAGLKLIFR